MVMVLIEIMTLRVQNLELKLERLLFISCKVWVSFFSVEIQFFYSRSKNSYDLFYRFVVGFK